MTEAQITPTDPAERTVPLGALFKPGDYRWAIYDRKTRTIYVGAADVHIHLTVAEYAGVLRNPSSYYRPGANILGGYVCRSTEGKFYYDPYSGTFPGTYEGVEEAETALKEICGRHLLPFQPFKKVPKRALAVSKYL